jgi:hypothetical protein
MRRPKYCPLRRVSIGSGSLELGFGLFPRYPLTRVHTVADYQEMARQMYGADADEFLKFYPVNRHRLSPGEKSPKFPVKFPISGEFH